MMYKDMQNNQAAGENTSNQSNDDGVVDGDYKDLNK